MAVRFSSSSTSRWRCRRQAQVRLRGDRAVPQASAGSVISMAAAVAGYLFNGSAGGAARAVWVVWSSFMADPLVGVGGIALRAGSRERGVGGRGQGASRR